MKISNLSPYVYNYACLAPSLFLKISNFQTKSLRLAIVRTAIIGTGNYLNCKVVISNCSDCKDQDIGCGVEISKIWR